jgi:quercetin dioxygenase-like cupin family protein
MQIDKNFLSQIIRFHFIICVTLVSQYAVASDAVANSVPAPDRGVIPGVSNHYQATPAFYDFDRMPAEQITTDVTRRFIMGTQMSMVRWDLKAGTKLPLHFHVNEQITRVESGQLEVYSQGKKYNVEAGQVMIFPPNVPHEFVAAKDTIIIEEHAPARQDFINGDFEKMSAPNSTNKK